MEQLTAATQTSMSKKTAAKAETLGEAFSARGRDEHNNFMFIRLAAASLVIYGHSHHFHGGSDFVQSLGYYYSGDLALHVFFVVSGFLVANSCVTSTLSRFVTARMFRIVPAFWVFTLLLALVEGPILTTLPLDQYLQDLTNSGFLQNNLLLRQGSYFLPGVGTEGDKAHAVNGTTWSLFIEVKLYLLLLIMGALQAFRTRIIANGAILAFLVYGAIWGESLPMIPGFEPNLRISAFFAIGCAMFVNRDHIPLDWRLLSLLLVASFWSYGTQSYSLVVGALIAYGALYLAFLPKLTAPKWIQDYSFGVYLYGYPVQAILYGMAPNFSDHAATIIALPLAWSLGAASWFIVEKPAMRLRKRIESPTPSRARPECVALSATTDR